MNAIIEMCNSEKYTFTLYDKIQDALDELESIDEQITAACQVVSSIEPEIIAKLKTNVLMSSVNAMEPIGIAVLALAKAGDVPAIVGMLRQMFSYDAFAVVCLLAEHVDQSVIKQIAEVVSE